MRRAPIQAVITMAVAATIVGSLTAPGVASPRVLEKRAVAAATSVQRVKIVDLAFRPKTITITKGTKVKWTNRGNVSHTTTSNGGVWDSGVLAPGDTFGRVFKKAGTFKYHCTIHSTMHGKIIVS